MRVIQVGNFGAPYSTENELRRGLEANGIYVTALQENHPGTFAAVVEDLEHPATDPDPDDPADEVASFVLWTRTRWDPPLPHRDQLRMLLAASRTGTPAIGYHLDRWWGLRREREVREDGFFDVDLLVTADGGHDEQWADAGIDHVWFPPAVDAGQAQALGTWRAELASDVAFVGSWRPGYHPEWGHRAELVAFLRRHYGERCRFWPAKNQPAVRGPALADLYQSAKVVIGDSCLAGGATHYWSDRIPETLGRGGYLLHPAGEGLEAHFEVGTHLDVWPLNDWPALTTAIDAALEEPDRRMAVASAGRAHVLAHHTYEVRMAQLVNELRARAMLPSAP